MFLDVDRLIVQQQEFALDFATSDRYIANHMTNRDGSGESVKIQRRKTMNRFRLVAIGAILVVALTTVAQQTTTGGADKNEHGQGSGQNHVPGVEQHMKLLTDKLDLTAVQQTKVKPILQEMHDTTQKAVQDESISNDQRMANVGTARVKADKQIREILNDDQKKQLDQLEREPHPELHGNIKGTIPAPARGPQN
jgi:Spy/CpxP family protein refolding chaperone